MAGGLVVAPFLSASPEVLNAAQVVCGTPAVDESVTDVAKQISNIVRVYDVSARTFSLVDNDNKIAHRLEEVSKFLNTAQTKIIRYQEVAHEWNMFRDTACDVQPFNSFLTAGNFIRQATSMPFKVLIISQIDRASGIADSIVSLLPFVSQQTQDDVFKFAENSGAYTKEVLDSIKIAVRGIGIESSGQ